MNIRLKIMLVPLAMVLLAGCQAEELGTDTMGNLKSEPGLTKTPFCVECHKTQEDINPMVINGSGIEGSHVAHVETSGIFCERCHGDYYEMETHFNGTLDGWDPAVSMVLFDSVLEPDATWEGDTGARKGSCANVSCHAPATPNWYNQQ